MKVIPLLRVRVLFVALLVLPLVAVADQPQRPGKAGIASAHQLATKAAWKFFARAAMHSTQPWR